jgi:hypothetical protein
MYQEMEPSVHLQLQPSVSHCRIMMRLQQPLVPRLLVLNLISRKSLALKLILRKLMRRRRMRLDQPPHKVLRHRLLR